MSKNCKDYKESCKDKVCLQIRACREEHGFCPVCGQAIGRECPLGVR